MSIPAEHIYHVPLFIPRDKDGNVIGKLSPNQKKMHQATSCDQGCASRPLAGKKQENGIINAYVLGPDRWIADFDAHEGKTQGTQHFRLSDYPDSTVWSTPTNGYHVCLSGPKPKGTNNTGIDILGYTEGQKPKLAYCAGEYGGITNEGYTLLSDGGHAPYRGQLDSVLSTSATPRSPYTHKYTGPKLFQSDKTKEAKCVRCDTSAVFRLNHNKTKSVGGDLSDAYFHLLTPFAGSTITRKKYDEAVNLLRGFANKYVCENCADYKTTDDFINDDVPRILDTLGAELAIPSGSRKKPKHLLGPYHDDRCPVGLVAEPKSGKWLYTMYRLIPDWLQLYPDGTIVVVSVDEEESTINSWLHDAFPTSNRIVFGNDVTAAMLELGWDGFVEALAYELDAQGATHPLVNIDPMNNIIQIRDKNKLDTQTAYASLGLLRREINKRDGQLVGILHSSPSNDNKNVAQAFGTGAYRQFLRVLIRLDIADKRQWGEAPFLTHEVHWDGNRYSEAPQQITYTFPEGDPTALPTNITVSPLLEEQSLNGEVRDLFEYGWCQDTLAMHKWLLDNDVSDLVEHKGTHIKAFASSGKVGS